MISSDRGHHPFGHAAHFTEKVDLLLYIIILESYHVMQMVGI